MSKFDFIESQRTLINLIGWVEEGTTTPEEAVAQLTDLKNHSATAKLNLPEYTLADFQKIRTDALSQYVGDEDELTEEQDG